MGETLSGSRRDLFDLPREAHWLNCAYMSPIPRATAEAGFEGIRRKVNPIGVGPDDFFTDSDRARALFAAVLDSAESERIALVPSVSYAIAAAARNLRVGPGRSVVVLAEQFPSNFYIWRRKVAEEGGELRVVGPGEAGPSGRGARWNRRILEAIDAGTAVVAVPHVHWTDGTRFDLSAVGERCREVGAALIVDGTQSMGAFRLDPVKVGADMVVAAGYKWLLGPYSIGGAWFGPRFDSGIPLEENWIVRKGSRDFQGLVDYAEDYAPGAVRFDVGERSNFVLVPMFVESLRLVGECGPEVINAHCRALLEPVVERAAEWGWVAEAPEFRAGHMVGIRAPAGVDLGAVREALARRNVHASLRGTALRLSPHIYNDGEDTAALLEALEGASKG